MKKRFYTIGILLAFTFALIIVRPEARGAQQLTLTPSPPATTTVTTATGPTVAHTKILPPPISPPRSIVEATSSHEAAPTPAPNVTILVASTSYRVYVPPDSTVLDAMRAASASSSFSFTDRDYASLGFFVESIEGHPNASGSYWFLYLNGTSSDTGASQTTLHDGDTVEWRYEKN